MGNLSRFSPTSVLSAFCAFVAASLRSRAALQIEILALRHQLNVLQRSAKRPRLSAVDRWLWVRLSRNWSGWRAALKLLKPATVVSWHYKGFRLFWTWKCRHGRLGRPAVSLEVRQLIRRMSRENQLWGAPRTHGELLKLGFDISETSVSKYLVCGKGSPSQSWKTFSENHVTSLVSLGFFTVSTIRFQIVYVFLETAHERRRIVHFAVTQHPTAEWTAHQLREACPWDTAPRFLLRDRDRIFGPEFVQQLKAMGIKQVLSTPNAPRQRGYIGRLIGTICCECLDHVIVFNESSLRRHLVAFSDYYHQTCTHLSLEKDAPDERPIQPANAGKIVAIPEVGGLHHRYERSVA
jgi:putative transposase